MHQAERRATRGVPALVVGAPSSGTGKTTVALGLVAALRARGLVVGACKVGPDYLDTGYHATASGRPAANLDLWMSGEDGVRAAFGRAARGADVVVVEGVMGLFDGHRDGSPSSTADVARVLGAPVVLVLDASKSAASLGALALGFSTFDERVQLVGVIANRFRAGRERGPVERGLARAAVPALGWLPSAGDIALPERHLGLVLAEEDRARTERALASLGELVEAHVDVEALLRLASSAVAASDPPAAAAPRARIAVARDDAFAFYYEGSLAALEAAGAELVAFSPLRDAAPPDVDGLYLGGGYPELHAEALAANASMREAVRAAVLGGMPTYAECGGMMYLGEELMDAGGRAWPMAGALPLRTHMHERVQAVGYREGVLRADGVLGRAEERVRAHEFRYSTVERTGDSSAAYDVVDVRGESVAEGFASATLLASYLHLDLGGAPGLAGRFVDSCVAARAVTTTERRPA